MGRLAVESDAHLSAVYFTTLMRARRSLKFLSSAKGTWNEMLHYRVRPDDTAYLAAFNLCGKTLDREWAETLWAELNDRKYNAAEITSDRRKTLIASYLYVHAACRN